MSTLRFWRKLSYLFESGINVKSDAVQNQTGHTVFFKILSFQLQIYEIYSN